MAPPARQTKSPGWADTTKPVFAILVSSGVPTKPVGAAYCLAGLALLNHSLLHDQGQRYRIEKVRYEAADDHVGIKVIRVVRRDQRDRDMHHDPDDGGEEHRDKRRLIAAAREGGPHPRKDQTPGEYEKEMDAGSDHIGHCS